MRRGAIFAATAAISLWAPAVLPCGGAFGSGFVISNAQTLVVGHKQGIETYVFQPHFCGKAAEFGLILPVPATLSASPSLADATLYDELAAVSAPRHVAQTQCRDKGIGNGGLDAGISFGGDASDGTTVIDKGKVGIFDWTLLKADTTAAFTSWLDANGYPHAASADTQFTHYVTQGWYFVAFKVTASSAAPGTNEKICGDFGPIALTFPAAAPVVPTRIAAVSTSDPNPLMWRIYGVSDQSLTVSSAGYYPYPKFSGTLGTPELASSPALAKLAAPGDRLVKIDVQFEPSVTTADLTLVPGSVPDFRETVYDITYIDCDGGTIPEAGAADFPVEVGGGGGGGGCAVGGDGSAGAAALAFVAFAGMLARRRRRGQGTPG